MTLLAVDRLTVDVPTADGALRRVVHDVSFAVPAGGAVGIVGESGSGKSLSVSSLLRLVPQAVLGGRAVFEGSDLLTLPDAALRRVRGGRIGMVFQDPQAALHPMHRVGAQVAEAVRAHERVSRRAARARAVDLLHRVGIRDAAGRAADYPHQFSGGMRQRVVLAMAIAARPALLVADEPTTALDVTVQAQILELFRRLRAEDGTALVLVSHDLAVVRDVVDTVTVLHAGRVVEDGPVADVYGTPRHDHTRRLLAAARGETAGAAAAGTRPVDGGAADAGAPS